MGISSSSVEISVGVIVVLNADRTIQINARRETIQYYLDKSVFQSKCCLLVDIEFSMVDSMDRVRNWVDILEEHRNYRQMPKDLEYIVGKLNRMNSISDRCFCISQFYRYEHKNSLREIQFQVNPLLDMLEFLQDKYFLSIFLLINHSSLTLTIGNIRPCSIQTFTLNLIISIECLETIITFIGYLTCISLIFPDSDIVQCNKPIFNINWI